MYVSDGEFALGWITLVAGAIVIALLFCAVVKNFADAHHSSNTRCKTFSSKGHFDNWP